MFIINSTLILVLTISLITDLKERKIYNKVLFPAIIIAFIMSFYLYGLPGLFKSVSGLFAGIGLLLIPYLMGGMGAGDVKLLGTIGALKGSAFVFYAFIYTALAGGVIALGIVLYQKNWLVFKRVGRAFLALWLRIKGIKIPVVATDYSSVMYPYGVAIVCGTVITIGLRGW
ncbi:MAG: prepilin peptidase [Bacillaceae bacterium]|nr:prepilin peptidase [Bacillaceae bacterium]